MATVTATNSAPGFDMSDTGFGRWSGSDLYAFAEVFGYTADDSGEGTYSPQVVNIYGEHNFTYDGAQNPTGGDATTVNINIDNNPNVAGIDFTGDVAIVADVGVSWPLTFVMPAGTAAETAANTFWATLLAGSDTILAPSGGIATIAGDGRTLSSGEVFGGNDSFSVSGGSPSAFRDDLRFSILSGDMLDVSNGILHGGADTFVLGGLSLYSVAGDAVNTYGSGTHVYGGHDTITANTTVQYSSMVDSERFRLVGDVKNSSSQVDGGNDTITGSDSAGVSDFLIGDVRYSVPDPFGAAHRVNGGDDSIVGRGGDDVLIGDVEVAEFGFGDVVAGGDDVLLGGAGDDALYGDVRTFYGYDPSDAMLIGGNDWLDGGAGRDMMFGGGGNDGYVFDDVGDQANETDGGGVDTVYTSVSIDFNTSSAIGDVENLTLLGTAFSGIGNGLGNVIIGNAAANILKGLAGDDFIRGGLGKDKLLGGAGANDTADYSDKSRAVSVTLNGSKTVSVKVDGKTEDSLKGIEHLIGGSKGDKLGGDSKANALLGGKGNDSLRGGGNADTLTGGKGTDQLRGDGGKDVFVFDTKLGAKHADVIADFKHNTDIIALDDALFTAIGAKLGKGEFYAKAGATQAHDANDHIIYNKSNGRLYFDADGKDGQAAVLFATLSTKPGLDHGDFAIV